MPSARKTQAICSRKIVMRSNGSGYPSGKIVIHRSNGLAIRSKNCHPFQRLELSVPKYCQPLYCSKPLSPDPRRPRGSQSAREERCKRGARGARKRAPGYQLSPNHFQTVMRILAPKTFVAFSADPTDCH